MTGIRHHKKQARLRAAINGTSHQFELNAIARENGHVAWGAFQRALKEEVQSSLNRFTVDDLKRHPKTHSEELADLIDAFQAARRVGGHLVVLRPTVEQEADVIALLQRHHDEHPLDERLEGMSFTPFIDQGGVAISDAAGQGRTLVSGSAQMHRDVDTGQFIIHHPRTKLTQLNRLYSRRDQEIIYATTAVSYVLAKNDRSTAGLAAGRIGATTIRRRSGIISDRPATT